MKYTLINTGPRELRYWRRGSGKLKETGASSSGVGKSGRPCHDGSSRSQGIVMCTWKEISIMVPLNHDNGGVPRLSTILALHFVHVPSF
jgi:hypothetical protein